MIHSFGCSILNIEPTRLTNQVTPALITSYARRVLWSKQSNQIRQIIMPYQRHSILAFLLILLNLFTRNLKNSEENAFKFSFPLDQKLKLLPRELTPNDHFSAIAITIKQCLDRFAAQKVIKRKAQLELLIHLGTKL